MVNTLLYRICQRVQDLTQFPVQSSIEVKEELKGFLQTAKIKIGDSTAIVIFDQYKLTILWFIVKADDRIEGLGGFSGGDNGQGKSLNKEQQQGIWADNLGTRILQDLEKVTTKSEPDDLDKILKDQTIVHGFHYVSSSAMEEIRKLINKGK